MPDGGGDRLAESLPHDWSSFPSHVPPKGNIEQLPMIYLNSSHSSRFTNKVYYQRLRAANICVILPAC